MHWIKRLLFKIFGLLLILYCIAALTTLALLPRYIQQQVQTVPGYQAEVGTTELSLVDSGITIENLKIIDTNQHSLLFSTQSLTYAINWKQLLKGHLLASLSLQSPVLNYMTIPSQSQSQTTPSSGWQQVMQKLFLIKLNSVNIHDGQIAYQDTQQPHPYKLSFTQLNVQANNLLALDHNGKLPATVNLQGKVFDDAIINAKLNFDPHAALPHFKLEFALENLSIAKANDLLESYTELRVKQGEFSLFVEAAAKQGHINGYAKPFIAHLELAPADNPLTAAYRQTVQWLQQALKNSDNDTVATKIPFEGNIDEPDASLAQTVLNLLYHAFIASLVPGVDHSISADTLPIISS